MNRFHLAEIDQINRKRKARVVIPKQTSILSPYIFFSAIGITVLWICTIRDSELLRCVVLWTSVISERRAFSPARLSCDIPALINDNNIFQQTEFFRRILGAKLAVKKRAEKNMS